MSDDVTLTLTLTEDSAEPEEHGALASITVVAGRVGSELSVAKLAAADGRVHTKVLGEQTEVIMEIMEELLIVQAAIFDDRVGRLSGRYAMVLLKEV